MGVLKKCGNFLTTSSTALINECLAVCASTVTNLRISFFSPKEILIFFVECRVLCKFEHPLSKP